MILVWLRRHRVALPVLVAIPLATFLLLDRASWIRSYRVVNEHTIVVTTAEGPGAWTRLTDVGETAESVTVTVRSFHFQLGPQLAYAVVVDTVVALGDPIGDRRVVDGSSGLAISLQK